MANRIHNALDTVKSSETLKTSTIQFLQVQRQKNTSPQIRPAVFRTIAAVCILLILTLGIGGYSMILTPVSFVSIDVNPSIELALNRFDRVVSATAFNEDGELVLDGLKLKGKQYTEAIDCIVESNNMSAYLTDTADLIFTVAADNRDKEGELRSGIENCSGCMGHGGQSTHADIDTITEAHHNGVSLGKYSAYLQLAQYDETVTIEECQDMSMSEIHHQISQHKHNNSQQNTSGNGCSSNSANTHRNRHGNGHHN